MKNYHRIVFGTNLFIVFALIFGCSTIEIERPPKVLGHLATPYDLEVVHKGCGRVGADTIAVWLDKGEETEEDITSHFTYSDERWTASDYPLPLGSHTLTARHDIDGPPLCFKSSSDEREVRDFVVYETTCIKGTVRYRGPNTPSPIRYPNAPVTALFLGSLYAETTADEAGNYCIEVPLGGFEVTLKVDDKPPPEVPYEHCGGGVEDINLGTTPNRCAQENCVSVDIEAWCSAI